jgi:hypothetical protein
VKYVCVPNRSYGLVSSGSEDKISHTLDEANREESLGLWKDNVEVRIILFHIYL